MIKVGILSDTHGTIHPRIVELMNDCDYVIHAGDVMEEDSLEQINPRQRMLAVRGNNDGHIVSLSDIESLELPGGKVVVEHGHMHGHYEPSHDSLRASHPEAKAIVYGHTHVQVIDDKQSPWVINPGSAGPIRNYGGARCLLLTIENHEQWDIKPHIYDNVIS